MSMGRVWLLAWLICMSTRLYAADWLDAREIDDMRPHPENGSVSIQTPPDFRWPFRAGAERYEIQVADKDGVTVSYTTSYNWLNPEKTYGSGAYRWRVRAMSPQDATLTGWSSWREFLVADKAQTFLVPTSGQLETQLASAPHPRAFPTGAELVSLKSMLDGVREQDWIRLQKRVRKAMGQAIPEEPSQPLNSIADRTAWAAALEDLPKRIRPSLTLTAEAAFAWRMTGNPDFLAEAKRRALTLAKWNPAGVTGWASQDQMTREFGYVLALTYDWLYRDLTPDERSILSGAAYARLKDIDAHIDGAAHSLARKPVNSHGWTALSVAAAMSSLLAGDVPGADRLSGKLIPWYYNSISPWGGEEGGHANGTAYGVWTFSDMAIAWDILRRTVGVDPADKSWSRGMMTFLAYMLPPGAPQNVFGDGAEERPVMQIAKRFLRRIDLPLARWYERQTFGEDGSAIWLLMAPYGSTDVISLPEGMGNAAIFPSVGMVAMHSSLAVRNRTSIYFKSSPYGSFNHSHADQNSFVIHSHGKPVMVSSGYYDYYGSPHWRGWYKQTRAHNAITFDGGQGQKVDSLEASGHIVQFATTPEIDVVTGDASQAYEKKLTTALRTLIYIRPGELIVIDRLKSMKPRTWEWNFHAREAFEVRGAGQVAVMDGDNEVLCVDVLQPNTVTFRQDNHFAVQPVNDKPPQWNGIFSVSHPVREATFVTRLSLDCLRSDTTVEDLGTAGLAVRTGDHRITVAPTGAFTLN